MSSLHKNLSDFSHLKVASASGLRFVVIVSQWNAGITGSLLEGALTTLEKHGADPNQVEVVKVPGSYELISGADIVLKQKESVDDVKGVDAVICLGCVIQGETRHFDFICSAVAHGLAQVGLKYGKPVIFGVLTTDNLEQAQDRSGGKHGNKGSEAAVTAIQMASLRTT